MNLHVITICPNWFLRFVLLEFSDSTQKMKYTFHVFRVLLLWIALCLLCNTKLYNIKSFIPETCVIETTQNEEIWLTHALHKLYHILSNIIFCLQPVLIYSLITSFWLIFGYFDFYYNPSDEQPIRAYLVLCRPM